MTKEEVQDLIVQIPEGLTVNEFLVALATKAAEWEREWCAYLCSATAPGRDAEAIEEAIRARGKK